MMLNGGTSDGITCVGCGEPFGCLHRLWCRFVRSHYDTVQRANAERTNSLSSNEGSANT